MGTVTVKGKVYQIGQPYIDDDGNLGVLESYNAGSFKLWAVGDTKWFCHSLFPVISGTITDAPIELEDGKAYAFDVNSTDFIGVYRESRDCFMNGGNKVCGRGQADNIEKLVRERT